MSYKACRIIAAAALSLFAAACNAVTVPDTVSALRPATPQPEAATLRSGLAVEYLHVIANSVDDVEIAGRGRRGKPLPMLNYDSADGPALTSTIPELLGARITGYIRFAEPGTYRLKARSNDGVRASISGVVVINDPHVHTSRFSNVVSLVIDEPGWYPFYMLYFQKRYTATLELHWQTPGAAQFELVPPEAYAHTVS